MSNKRGRPFAYPELLSLDVAQCATYRADQAQRVRMAISHISRKLGKKFATRTTGDELKVERTK